MTDQIDIETLGRRAVACKGWRWLPGMLTLDPGQPAGLRVAGMWPEGFTLWEGHGYGARGCTLNVASMDGDLPDLRDQATLGCLLALVREACGEPCITTAWGGMKTGWRIWNPSAGGVLVIGCASEAEALVAALEAAQR